MSTVEIAVVGGGPAGAATACALAEAGREVMLLERSGGPHHKVCGEFLSAETVAYLGRLGIDPSALGAVAIDRAAVTTAGATAEFPLPFRAVSLSRYRLDQAIIERAAKAGADLRLAVAVQCAEPLTVGWRMRCSDGRQITCRGVVVATGKWRLRGIADRRDGSMVGLKMHLRLPAANTRALAGRVELFPLNQGYGGLEPIEDGVVNLCLILPAGIVAGFGRGWPALRDFLASNAPSLAARLEGGAALWDEPLAVVCPSGGYLLRASRSCPDAIYRVGDRLAHIPPLAGDGLAIALASADLAAKHIKRGSPAAAYLTDVRCRIAPAVRLAAAVGRLTGHRFGRGVLASAAAHAPGLMQTIARGTRLRPFEVGPERRR